MTDPAISSGALQTPLAGATVLRAGWQASRGAKLLADGQFDQAPVFSRKRLVGYALTKDLAAYPRRRVRGVAHSIDQDIVLSGASGVGALLLTLRDRAFAFIVGQEGITGFVTPSDLNKQAARAHFYLLIAALEIGVANLLRRSGQPQNELIRSLTPAAQGLIERRFKEDSSAGIDVDYLIYLEFSQLLNLVGRDSELASGLGYAEKSEWRQATDGLIRLRHDVMHPTRPIYGRQRTVADLIACESRLQSLLDRVAGATAEPAGSVEAASPRQFRPPRTPERTRKLHEAMELVLLAEGQAMRPRDIATRINLRSLYRRGDGLPVPSGQVSARANNYPQLFVRTPNGLALHGQDGTDD
jgi:hypothetical protein